MEVQDWHPCDLTRAMDSSVATLRDIMVEDVTDDTLRQVVQEVSIAWSLLRSSIFGNHCICTHTGTHRAGHACCSFEAVEN